MLRNQRSQGQNSVSYEFIVPCKQFGGARIPDAVMRMSGLSAGAKAVYQRLALCAGKRGIAFPSQKWIAEALSLSVRSVANHLNALLKLGLIATSSRGAGRSLNYYFPYHPAMGELRPEARLNAPEASPARPARPAKPVKSPPARGSISSPVQGYANFAEGYANLADIISSLKEELRIFLSYFRSSETLKDEIERFFSGFTRSGKTPDLEISKNYPLVTATGFGQSQLSQIYSSLSRDPSVTPADLEKRLGRALLHAEETLRLGPLKDKDGQMVRNPKSYIFKSLMNDGDFAKPKGWLSPEERLALAEEHKRKERERFAERQKAEATERSRKDNEIKFNAWRNRLSVQELQNLKSIKEIERNRSFIKNFETWLRVKFWPENKTQLAFQA